MSTIDPAPLKLAVVGAGPAGLALALGAARQLPGARITVYDARDIGKDVAGDPRALALSLGSVHLLRRLKAWPAAGVEVISEVHVSQAPPSLGGLLARWLGEPEVRLRAADERVEMLGAVLSHGTLTSELQRAWLSACAAEPTRLVSRFGAPVTALKNVAGGVEVDAGIVELHDLAVIAEGGVCADRLHRPLTDEQARPAAAAPPTRVNTTAPGRLITRDYRQTAWVGTVALPAARRGVAYERFTRHGPAALLPLAPGRAALVWCVDSDDDPVGPLSGSQRLAVLNTLFHPEVGRVAEVSPLKSFALGLNAERNLVDGRMLRIGNAAQTLHPVAGQGLNLGLRDGFELVQALSGSGDLDAVLRRLETRRAPDRWAMIVGTDFLARSFTWTLPGAGTARGLSLAALQMAGPLKSLLARQMMFGRR